MLLLEPCCHIPRIPTSIAWWAMSSYIQNCHCWTNHVIIYQASFVSLLDEPCYYIPRKLISIAWWAMSSYIQNCHCWTNHIIKYQASFVSLLDEPCYYIRRKLTSIAWWAMSSYTQTLHRHCWKKHFIIRGTIKNVLGPCTFGMTKGRNCVKIISLCLDALSPTLFHFSDPFKIESKSVNSGTDRIRSTLSPKHQRERQTNIIKQPQNEQMASRVSNSFPQRWQLSVTQT